MVNSFVETDEREFVLEKGINFEVVIYQIDILRIIKILESVNSKRLSEKLRRAIFIRDYNKKEKTDFKRGLPRSEVERYVMNLKQYREYLFNQEALDDKIEVYYAQIK